MAPSTLNGHVNGNSTSPSVFACLSPIGLGDIQQMDMSLSRLDCLFLAKVADQAERYHGTSVKVSKRW